MTTFNMTIYDSDDTEYEVVVDYDAEYQEAYVSGPPEDCYPADSEMTINSVLPAGSWPDMSVGWYADIVESEQARIEEAAWEHFHSVRHDQ